MKRFFVVSLLIIFSVLWMSTKNADSYWEFTLPDGRLAWIYPQGEWGNRDQIGVGVEVDPSGVFDFFYLDSKGNLRDCCEATYYDNDYYNREMRFSLYCKHGVNGSWRYFGLISINY